MGGRLGGGGGESERGRIYCSSFNYGVGAFGKSLENII